MSQFPTPAIQAPKLLTPRWDDDERPARAAAVDSLIAENRRLTPPEVANKRAVPRMSIAELNAADIDQIRERFGKVGLDTRGPVVKFLDILDLPRNTIAGVLAPSIKRRKEAAGDTATFGQGRVNFSDILDDLGVENRVARGVLGFVGDVALDPLTYAGPAGWGVRGASAAGKSAQLTKGFAKAAQEAVAAAKLGGEAADPLIRQYVRSAGLKTADEVGTALFGTGRTRLNKALRVVGEDIEGKGGSLLTDALDDVIHPLTAPADAERIRAAKAIVTKYGRDNAPGLRIGRNDAGKLAIEAGSNPGTTIKAGTGIAHIPFTDIQLSVPAFTNRARMGIAAGQLARGVESAGTMNPDIEAVHNLTSVVNSRATEAESLRARQSELDKITTSVPAGTPMAEFVAKERASNQMRMQEIVDELGSKDGPIQKINDQMRVIEDKGAQGLSSAADILYAQKVYSANKANADRLLADFALRNTEQAGARAKWKELTTELPERINKIVGEKQAEHIAAEAARLADWQNETNAVMEANKAEEARRIMEGVEPHPVLGHDPLAPLPAPHQPIPFDEAAARVEAEKLARASMEVSPETMEAADKLATVLHAKMDANANLAVATSGPLDATLSAADRSIMDAAKMVVGLSPDDLGHAMFAPMKSITASIADDREGVLAMLAKSANNGLSNADAKFRELFGRHSGKTHDLIRDYLRASSPASNPMVAQTLEAVGRDVKDIVGNAAHNIKPEQQPEFERLLGNMIDAVSLESLPDAKSDAVYDIINEARSSGLFSEATHPGLYAAARAFADKWKNEIRSLGEMEQAARQLGPLKEGYGLPSMVSREAATRIGNNKKFAAGLRGQPSEAAGNVGKLVEAFQKPRSTDMFRWTDAEGNAREFMEAERVYASIPESTLNIMDPDAANNIRAIQQNIKDFDALKEAGKAPKATPVSRAQVNKWVKDEGRFRWLTGGALDPDGPGFFETAVSHAIANRYGSSYKSYLHSRLMDWATQYARPLATQKIDKVWQASPDGTVFRFRNGASGRLYKGKNNEPFLVVGDQRFRQLRGVELEAGKYNPAAAILRDKAAIGQWFPEEVADLIERANAPFRDESSIEAIIKGADEINKLWKTTTLFHPSWTIGDIVGTLYLAASGGISIPGMVKRARDAQRIVMAVGRRDPEALSKIELVAQGRKLTGLDVARAEGAAAMFGAGNSYEAAMQLMASGHMVPQQTWKLWKNPGKAIAEDWDRAAQFAEAEMHGKEWGKAKNAAMKGEQVRSFLKEGVARRVVAPWFQLNGTVNDIMRVSAFLSLLDEGYDAASATRKISEKLFDMSTMTATEQGIRRFFPFYAWTKASGTYGIRQLMENPKFFTIAPHVKHALEEAANGEENLPENQRPSWMRDQQAALFGKGDTRKAVLFGSLLPQEAAAFLATGLGSPVLGAQALQDAVSYFGNQLSPVVKAPLELASHREWFTKREIGGDAGDLTVGEYLANQVRPLKELGLAGVRQSPLKTAFERSPAEGAARVFLGGRAQPAGDERIAFNNQRETDDRIRSTRKRINLAEREGAKGESLAKRVELLAQYKDAATRGIAIPVWARKQLIELGALPGTHSAP